MHDATPQLRESSTVPKNHIILTRLRTGILALALATVLGSLGAPLPASAIESGTNRGGASQAQRPSAKLDFPRLDASCYRPGADVPRAGVCYLTRFRRNRPTVVLWGDSHAWQYLPAVRRSVKHRPVNLVTFLAGGCPPTISPPKKPGGYYTKCQYNNQLALEYVAHLKARGSEAKIILGSNWSGYRRAYHDLYVDHSAQPSDYGTSFTRHMIRLAHRGTHPLFETLASYRVRVDVIAQSATIPPDHRNCPAGNEPYQCALPRHRAILDEADTARWLHRRIRPLAGTTRYIDPSPYYCSPRVCHAHVNDVNTYYDYLHLGATLTKNMLSYFAPSVRDLLRH